MPRSKTASLATVPILAEKKAQFKNSEVCDLSPPWLTYLIPSQIPSRCPTQQEPLTDYPI